jgi:outer membrane protein assembly factor BamB
LLVAALAIAVSSAVACASGGRKPLAPPVVMFPGGVIWQLAFESPPAHVPAFDADRVYVALRDGTLAAVEHASGRVVWSEARPATVPPVAAGHLLVGAEDDRAWAVDAGTGREIWQHQLAAKAALGPVASAGGALYLTDGGEAILLALEDGRERWKLPVGRQPRSLSASGGSAWMGFEDGRVLAVDVTGGRISWTRKLPSAALVITPLGDRLFVGSANQFLYALKAKSGGVKWRWRTGGSIAGPAAADSKRVYFVSRDATLRALDRRHGDLRWQRPLSSRAVGGPLLAGDILIVAGVSPELRGFRTGDGGAAGVVTIPGWAVHGPVLAAPTGTVPGRVLQLTAGGQLLAIGQTVEPPIVPLDVLPGRRLGPEVLGPVR